MEFRCKHCYGGGIVGLGEADAAHRQREEDRRQGLHVTARCGCTPQSDPMGPDGRLLVVELQQACPPAAMAAPSQVLFGGPQRGMAPGEQEGEEVAQAVESPLVSEDEEGADHGSGSGSGDGGTRSELEAWTAGAEEADGLEPAAVHRRLRSIIAADQPLGEVLAKADLRTLRERLAELAAAPADEPGAADQERTAEARRVLRCWSAEKMFCRNALIAEWCPLLSSLTGSNSNAVQMGAAGAGAKATTVYTAKYSAKETVDIDKAATVLREAARRIREHPSTADDSGAPARVAKHYCQVCPLGELAFRCTVHWPTCPSAHLPTGPCAHLTIAAHRPLHCPFNHCSAPSIALH